MFIGFLLIIARSFEVSEGAIALVSPTSAVRRTLALCVASRSKLLKFPRPPVYQALGPENMLLALRIATQNYSWAWAWGMGHGHGAWGIGHGALVVNNQ
ncbi:hypothetical protein QUA35_19515 [Microcoleus sp. N9_B2]|uniref:hypothetical protein n=1 Tax=unclassified Microcoleus TaxID=2642155 RepID=UPI002FD26538